MSATTSSLPPFMQRSLRSTTRRTIEHPEWPEVREDGSPAPQLCFAVPEVRAHKVAILREAAAYGLDGLLFDTLRHPPMVGYHPAVVAAFRARHGEDPPRESETRLPMERTDNRTGERHAVHPRAARRAGG